MADGMDDSALPEGTGLPPDTTETIIEHRLPEHAAEPAIHNVRT
jgi:hypothetical protein